MRRNDITGDSLTTKAATDKFREGHDRIWGKKPCEHDWSSDGDPGPGENMICDLVNLAATRAEEKRNE